MYYGVTFAYTEVNQGLADAQAGYQHQFFYDDMGVPIVQDTNRPLLRMGDARLCF